MTEEPRAEYSEMTAEYISLVKMGGLSLRRTLISTSAAAVLMPVWKARVASTASCGPRNKH